MPLDPAAGIPTTPAARQADKLAELERRVKNLEQARPTITAAAGAPSGEVREGTPYAQTDVTRLWLYLNGAWRFVAVA